MWIQNPDNGQWTIKPDTIEQLNFSSWLQDQQATRYFSRCLNGATFVPTTGFENVYDILSVYQPKTWYVSLTYSTTLPYVPPAATKVAITGTTSFDYYSHFLPEYGMTLKNLFTPKRLVNNEIENYNEVDLATTDNLSTLGQSVPNLTIDGIKLKEGHRVLVKDQIDLVTLPVSTDPNAYFTSNYYTQSQNGVSNTYHVYNKDNGIYKYTNSTLVRETDLDNYTECIRYSVLVKMGSVNAWEQFHLSRLLSGYFPSTSLSQPIEFLSKHNYVLRNQVEYINLFEITFNDCLKHATQSVYLNGITYSIPQRSISVGDYGLIVVYQEGIKTIINNKYQYNLMSITETSDSYWMCGDYGTLLKISKIDFSIIRIDLGILTILNSVSFFNDSRGVVVGKYNIIFYTDNGGSTWKQINYPEFMPYSFNKVLYFQIGRFAIGGDTGVFIDFIYSNGNWTAYKKHVSKFVDFEDEYLLVENINDMLVGMISPTMSVILIATNNGNIIEYDFDHLLDSFDFKYLNINNINYGDIKNIAQVGTSVFIYFTSDQLYYFDLTSAIIPSTTQSNIYSSTFSAVSVTSSSPNQIFDFNGIDLTMCGNNSLFIEYDYSTTFTDLDPGFSSRLIPRLLFLDYDIGSKLNFWDSSYTYRLPNSISFTASELDAISLTGSTVLELYSLTQSGIYGSNSVEMNWIEYWKDRGKTFEYYSHMDDTYVVKPSFVFETSNVVPGVFTYTASHITTRLSDILPMAPNITSTTESRYIDTGLTIFPSTAYNLYVYDYLMIWVVVTPGHLGGPQAGDMVHISCDSVDAVLMINKVIKVPGFRDTYYQYIYTNFNGNIINNISQETVKISNLNKYKRSGGKAEFVAKFNTHPVKYGYNASLDSTRTVINITPLFTNKSSYYNLQSGLSIDHTYPHSVSYLEMRYSESFFQFGYNPTYNLLDYLSQINPNNYFPTREMVALPVYQPIPSVGYPGYFGASNSNIYVSSNDPTKANKLYFGSKLVDQWNSLFQWTFVDIVLYDQPPTIITPKLTEQLLIMNKYYDSVNDQYIIEFHKGMDIPPVVYQVEIQSRRTIAQISGDLQYLNTIHRPTNLVKSIEFLNQYTNYETDINFKIPTDSYAKVFLSDDQFVNDISGLIYVDDTNELSMNITKLEVSYQIPIVNTSPIVIGLDTYVMFVCSENHHLTEDQGVTIVMNGGTGSSEQLNQQYMGYHVAHVVNSQDFYIEIPYGLVAINDIGVVSFVKKDPFLIYQPIDIFDLAQDKTVQQAVAIQPENYQLNGSEYNLVNVDTTHYTYQLRDGLTITDVTNLYPWILDAELSDAIIGLDSNKNLVWYDGVWICGRWFGGTWLSGSWLSGDWYSGTWNSKPLDLSNPLQIKVNTLVSETATFSTWYTGRWYDGLWTDGTWYDGRRYGGTWSGGNWYNGVWNDGTWVGGTFSGGIWVLGDWLDGDFNCDVTPAYWLDGKWYGGDFENGMWYNGLWDQKNGKISRFGTRSFNSRTSTWHGGKWISGQFHSQLNQDVNGNPIVSNTHKYSIWRTGFWGGGDFWGGIAYNTDFRGGEWHGGILDEIQLIGINSGTMSLYGNTFSNYLTLNGIFKFNIGDEFWIIDNNIGNTYSVLGSNTLPRRCKALYILEDTQYTYVEIDVKLGFEPYTPFPLGITVSVANTGLWVVSKFTNATFDSGIWTNGILDNSYFNGGIWYNGVVENSSFQ